MYINNIRSCRFPVGLGAVQMNADHIAEYYDLLVSIGTAKKSRSISANAELINASHAPGHRDMVVCLEPKGEPEMIVLAYWMPDLDTSVGESLVARLSYEYSDSKAITMVLSEGGLGIFPSAIEYIEREIRVNGKQEVWLFYLNQFQGAAPDGDGLFWKEPGMGTWIKFSAKDDGKDKPKIRISRTKDTVLARSVVSDLELWSRQSSAIDRLSELERGSSWRYSYQSLYNKIGFELSAGFVE